MTGAWELLVDRNDLAATRLDEKPVPEPRKGEALLRVDRVGVTANNVTYALVGETMNYWNFFPAADGWGRVPLWGFADVSVSKVPSLATGTRLYGYLPPSSHLIVRPDRITNGGFRDSSPHRAQLPSPYNIYQTTTHDPAYELEREDLQVLYRPLFITSFMLDDFLGDNAFFGAEVAVLSSASSKTAYGAAFCIGLREERPRLVGLTSARNVRFTESLGCYDAVVSYGDLATIATDKRTIYVDMAGSVSLREQVHVHFGAQLAYDAVVGATHLDSPFAQEDVPGPQPEFFFAPTQMKKRSADWGPGGIERNYGEAWRRFAPTVEGWVDVVESKGSAGLCDAWLEVLSGKSDPRAGHVIDLSG